MKHMVHSRFFCILLTISMLILGVFCGESHTNSSFSRVSAASDTASLQSVGSVLDTHIYCEKNSLSFIEDFLLTRQSVRTTAGIRIGQLLITALFVIATYLILLSFRNSFLCTDAFDNQYCQRTLEYIHQNDGKKS